MADWMSLTNPMCCCGGGGTTPPGGIDIPGCLCQGTPASLSLTVAYSPGTTAADYANAYPAATLAYYADPPDYMPEFVFNGPGYYSTTSWIDDYGFIDYYRLTCFSSQYALGFGQNTLGTWQAPVQIWTWTVGASHVVLGTNTCSPFALPFGNSAPGFPFLGRFAVAG